MLLWQGKGKEGGVGLGCREDRRDAMQCVISQCLGLIVSAEERIGEERKGKGASEVGG